ncbi:MAG: DUF2892 domain-containing protein [candidate division Zixibacteria bacterium]|nr:DUF2892 domain-containing protein [candidate division Zixibacteria bacterium]
MKANIGKTDRIIRLIIGLAILLVGLAYGSWWGLLGLIPIGTTLTGYCGLYSILGVNTCKTRQETS